MDWIQFAISMVVAAAFMYMPGWLLFRACRFSGFLSLVLAPIGSLVGYGVISICFGVTGVFTNWAVLFFCLLAISFCLHFVLRRFCCKVHEISLPNEDSFLWKTAILYLGIALLVTGWVFVRTLDGVDSFIPGNDNTTHLNTIQQFIDTGNWSTLAGGYYPRGWVGIATMVAQAMSINAPFAANVMNSVVVCFVYPLSMLGFLAVCFRKRNLVVVCGSVCVLAFTAYPWNVLAGSPISPNVLGFATVPLALMLLMLLFRDSLERKQKIIVCLGLLLFCVSCVFSHPNALFTAGAFSVPYCIYRIIVSKNQKLFPETTNCRVRRSIAITAFLIVVSLLWVLFYINPLLASVTGFHWPAVASLKQALFYTASLSFIDSPAQWVAAGLIVVGIVYTVFRRQYLWVTFAFLIFCCLYILNITTDGFVKQLLTGFWYTASRRLSAAAVIIGVPLLALGLYSIVRLGQLATRHLLMKKSGSKILTVIVLAVFMVCNYCPSFLAPGPTGQINTSFGYMTDRLKTENIIQDNWILDQNERDFFNEVKSVVGEDEVFNLPYDGSAFAYALNQINVYNKHFKAKSDNDSVVLQCELNMVSSNTEVQQALENRGIHWLMILDYQGGEYSTVEYDHDVWRGVVSVTDETPGFEVVLSKGDMRLYRILS